MKVKRTFLIVILTVTGLASSTAAFYVPCVSEICGGAGLTSRMRGINIAPSYSSAVLGQVHQNYPWVYEPLFPLSYPGAYDYWNRVLMYRYF